MTIAQLEYLLAVANCGSFSLAAQHCFVTQPSLSMQVKGLEEELGVILLDRSKKPVIPTQAGEAVLEQVREVLQAYYNIREMVSQRNGQTGGVLRLGVIPSVGPYLLHKLLPVFQRDYPGVELRVSEASHGQLADDLKRDRIDTAIVAQGTCGDVHEHELFDDPFCLYVSPQSPLYARTNVRYDELDPSQIILPPAGSCLRDQILGMLSLPKQTQFASVETGSVEGAIRLVDQMDLVAILPQMTLTDLPEQKRDGIKMLARGAISRKIVVAVRRTYVKSVLVRALIDAIGKCGI